MAPGVPARLLSREGERVNRTRVQRLMRLMRLMGIEALADRFLTEES